MAPCNQSLDGFVPGITRLAAEDDPRITPSSYRALVRDSLCDANHECDVTPARETDIFLEVILSRLVGAGRFRRDTVDGPRTKDQSR